MAGWKLRAAAALLSVCGLALVGAPAYALLVRPVVVELTSTGNGASSSLEVVNDRNIAMTVEVKVQTLTVPEKGDRVCFTLFEHEQRGGAKLPDPEDTPWTHGGPPGEAVQESADPLTPEDVL